MRKEPKPSRGNGFMNLLFLVVVGWIVYSLYSAGHLDDLLRKAGIGWEPITSLEDVTCQEIKEDAIGVELENRETKVVTEIIAIRDVVEVSRTESELVCKGELLTDDGGVNDVIKMTISDWDGKFMIQYSSYPEYQEGIYEELLDLIDEITD
jgi:hypothetical protein